MQLKFGSQGLWSLVVLLLSSGAFAQVNPGAYLLYPGVSIDFNGDIQLSPSAKNKFSFEKGRDIQKVWGKSGDYGLVVRGASSAGVKSLAEVVRAPHGRTQMATFVSYAQGDLESATTCQSEKIGGKEFQASGTKVGINKWDTKCMTVTPYMCRTLGNPEGLEASAQACKDFLGDVKTVVKSMPKGELEKLDKLDRSARSEISKITRNLKGMEWVKETHEGRSTDVREIPVETEMDFEAVAWLGRVCQSLNLADSLEGGEKAPAVQQIKGKSGPKKTSRPGVI